MFGSLCIDHKIKSSYERNQLCVHTARATNFVKSSIIFPLSAIELVNVDLSFLSYDNIYYIQCLCCVCVFMGV